MKPGRIKEPPFNYNVRKKTGNHRPKPWSSYTNIYTEKMNADFRSPTMARRTGTTSYDFPEKSPKKDKKWSFGRLFRIRKKVESDGSSDEEMSKSSGSKKKKKQDKKRKGTKVANFDHVVGLNGYKSYEDGIGILSEPSFSGRTLPKVYDRNLNGFGTVNGYDPNLSKKDRVKARAVARRDHSKCESSSDESVSSRFRSDESLSKNRDGSLSRRSRAARTERYLKRLSHSEENRENARSAKSDIEPEKLMVNSAKIPPSRSPNRPNISSHLLQKYRTINVGGGKQNFQDQTNRLNPMATLDVQRSLSCDADIHNASPSPVNGEIVHAQFCLGKPFNPKQRQHLVINQHNDNIKQPPPPPPPRDPRRIGQNYDNRPVSYSFESGYQEAPKPIDRQSNFNPTCRSTSEDHIPLEPLHRVPLHPRPSSTTPESNYSSNFLYFTDKQPRSRKPISVQTQPSKSQKTFDFWRQKEEQMQTKSPTVFTAQTHVKTTLFPPCKKRESSPFRPISPGSALKSAALVADVQQQTNNNDKPKNLEDALDELEAIYNSLHLGDEDLLDRAEQREQKIQSDRKKRWINRSDPDRRGDDMAFRKLHKEKSKTLGDPQSVSSISYLLSSPLYNDNVNENPPPVARIVKKSKEPDVTYDDVVYRNLKHTNQALKVLDPQPPFGIPLGPITPAANSDYLHAAPETVETFKPSKIPDIVKDDLAYRNLRKDSNKEPSLPITNFTNFTPDDYLNNNRLSESNRIGKKRPVRSLSANLFNTMQKEWEESLLNDNVQKGESISDVADALEIARQILKEKEERIQETKKAFMSDGDTKYRRYGSKIDEDSNGYHRKVQVQVPLMDQLKDKVSSSGEKAEEDELEDATIDQLLTDLAEKARETSDRISNELKMLDQDKAKIDSTVDNAKEITSPKSEIVVMDVVPVDDKKEPESEHDYENIDSENEEELLLINDDNISIDLSPLEKHREEILSAFSSANKETDATSIDKEAKREETPTRTEETKDLILRQPRYHRRTCKMSDFQQGRADRVARYKEERRRQLASQFGSISEPQKLRSNSKTSSSSSEEPRATRTSRLRAAASSPGSSTGPKINKDSEKNSFCGARRIERDKSNKRKSNLNRALNSEAISLPDSSDDLAYGRRRGRSLLPEDSPQSLMGDSNINEIRAKSDPPTISSVPSSTSRTPKKSSLRIHMENARKGVLPSCSEMGKYNRSSPRRTPTRSIKSYSDFEVDNHNKENIDTDPITMRQRSNQVSKRMEELTALTRETLARVERLAKQSRDSPSNKSLQRKKSAEESHNQVSSSSQFPAISNPVSILKRKVSQEETRASTSTPPVTFSPSVIDPPNRKKQGILKKRRSLDEAQVLRHRSCSPEKYDRPDRSILKSKRRSSLEDLVRSESPEPFPHSILKRKTSRNDDNLDFSNNSPEPHGILKRKSGTSSASSSSSSPHVSIATAVILAAAGGAEMILEPADHVKPILKKKSFEEASSGEDVPEVLRPILKKKSSTDTDECEDKPKRPILKNSTSGSREGSPRSRLSFSGPGVTVKRPEVANVSRQHRAARRQTLDSYFRYESPKNDEEKPVSVFEMIKKFETTVKSTGAIPKRSNQNRSRYRTQPITYDELEASLHSVETSFQKDLPSSSAFYSHDSVQSQPTAHSLVNLTQPYDENLSNTLLSSYPNSAFHPSISSKMSSDSAFQSLGDGLELEHEEKPIVAKPVLPKASPMALQMKALAQEAKNLQLKRSGSSVSRLRSRRDHDDSRFSTQPVTVNEVQEAAKLNTEEAEEIRLDRNDPCRLSLSERIKLFSSTPNSNARRRVTRFQTQPVTVDEVENALCAYRKSGEKKGILKPKLSPVFKDQPKILQDLKSALKKRDSDSPDSTGSPRGLRSILKAEATDFSRDEGISSDKSESESELEECKKEPKSDLLEKGEENVRLRSAPSSETQTSDGDSSGGREVRAIIRESAGRRRFRQGNEGSLAKSCSQSGLKDDGVANAGVRRSLTEVAMPKTIAELQAKLQKSGDSEWRKRIPKLNSANEELSLLNVKNIINDEISEKNSILAARKDELDHAAKQWKNRVEQSDADNFSVAGKLKQAKEVANINLPPTDRIRRTPKAKKYKGKEDEAKEETVSQPTSPEKNEAGFKRSISLPGSGDTNSSSTGEEPKISTRRVLVTRPDDTTFQNFFKNLSPIESKSNVEISADDLDSVVRQADNLLVQKRTVKVQRTREGSRNPVKALAARKDLKNEYTEIITGVAEREKLRLNVEKLSKSSPFAIEALAGLASKEDFTSVALKRSSSLNLPFLPFMDLMLLQVKGRRHVQTRLIEPTAANINEGDCFVLVTNTKLFNYVGAYANVIEKSRACDIVTHILQSGDMGCKTDKVVTINSKKLGNFGADEEEFWNLLGGSRDVIPSGHPDEDEIYEASILDTNMIYDYKNNELVPLEGYWGTIPKIEMLDPSRIVVFDFGTEMYVWSGKNAYLEQKKKALKLARELWNEGFNYTDCGVCPINVAAMLGARPQTVLPKKGHRPSWALFAKITQHRETILFKEKFLDWPDFTRVIRVKRMDSKEVAVKFDFPPCDVQKMIKGVANEPDLLVDQLHLGRGDSFYDEETSRMFTFDSKSVTVWIILEYSHERLPERSIGQFHDGNSYIIRWEFCATVTGRELSGKPSKHIQSGRDHCVYFCWQGSKATVNEKGAAALLTIELDSENARQIRIVQGSEPPAFLTLLKGGMVVHRGKREKSDGSGDFRLYICRGEMVNETVLTEVPCSMKSLRTRTSFLLIGRKSNLVTIWHGNHSSKQSRILMENLAERISKNKPKEFGFGGDVITVDVVEEMKESREFLQALGGNKRQLYMSIEKSLDFTPRLFHLSSISGNFEVAELLCPHRSQHTTPYPFLQSDLYSANQPTLFVLDNGGEVWLWQGWWPEQENDVELVDQTGSGAVRWQAERRAAMQTVVNYCREKGTQGFLVWAGLEPLSFTNLFPFWTDRDDVAELNIQDGRKSGEIIPVEQELSLLTRSTYPLEQLLQRPLPDGVDPSHLEDYLSSEDFMKLMSVSLDEFRKLPIWKQTTLKKEKGLF